MVFIHFPYTSTRTFFQKKLQCYFFVTKNSQLITSFTKKHQYSIVNLFFCNEKRAATKSCSLFICY
ncbi:hypothetical protein CON27_26100 [Bacillus thuringiensis]|uniref:Uncharacterized protein n=1 Tax=Bacillus thuringiensis TaxID=1428 RepID=A0A9X6ZSV4_BACTU|nr:hypothetical protein BK711_16465 [Bacillus thuringiensis serovar fukuokaensis]PEB68777.1 hypothetical protein COM91_15515 [Bacillus thuringiensis]PFJ39285.1 hypothetical protein COJ15_15065 [Bacillus thuringiensis]PFL31176.1 hypothetical protein COJ26_22390 [Bacillus thuringiensis]PFN53231.1 hypothetical protein COJ75_23950 [Bacillus thuringiensis]